MTTSPDIWPAFLKTLAMLSFVISLLVLVFYFIKRFSAARGIKGSDRFIKTLCVHYLSPKEKIVLLDVLGEKILIGVTPQNITRIASINGEPECDKNLYNDDNGHVFRFSEFFAKAMNFSSARSKQKKFSSLVNIDAGTDFHPGSGDKSGTESKDNKNVHTKVGANGDSEQ